MNWKTFKDKFVTGNPFSRVEGHFTIFSNGYKFNQYLFYGFIGVLVALGVYVFSVMGWSLEPQIYYKCNQLSMCDNPFYEYNFESLLSDRYKDMCKFDWCNEPNLPGGFEFGRKATYLEENFTMVALLLLSLTFFINHLLYNRGFKVETN